MHTHCMCGEMKNKKTMRRRAVFCEVDVGDKTGECRCSGRRCGQKRVGDSASSLDWIGLDWVNRRRVPPSSCWVGWVCAVAQGTVAAEWAVGGKGETLQQPWNTNGH